MNMKFYNKDNRFKLLLTMILASVLMHSCYKERLGLDKISGGTWNPTLAAPIFYGDLNMSKLVEANDENWKEYPDGLLSLVYRGDTISDLADQIINFPDQSNDTTLAFVLPPNLFPGNSHSQIFLIESKFVTNSNERLDSILIKSGTLTIEITTNLNHNSSVDIIIPAMTEYGNTGQTFFEKVIIPYTGGTSTTVTKTFQLKDYFLVINKNGSNSNIVEEYIKVFVEKGNGSDNSPYTVSVKQTMSSVTYFQAFGYFNQHTLNISESSIAIGIFDNLHYSEIIVEEPILKMVFRNTYGLPMDMNFSKLYVEKEGVQKDILSSLLPTIPLNYPDFSNVGGYDTTNVTFTSTNSNIVDVVNFNPQKLVYEGTVLSNPTAAILPNFLLDTSGVNVSLELEIPLYGRALEFTLEDTTAVDFSEMFAWDDIESIDLNINTLNYFPMEAILQLYLADSNGVVYDSIFDSQDKLLEAATPGPPPDYRTSIPIHQMITVKMSNSKLDNLKNAEKMIISTTATTYDQGSKVVKIYSDYKISVELSAKGNYTKDY